MLTVNMSSIGALNTPLYSAVSPAKNQISLLNKAFIPVVSEEEQAKKQEEALIAKRGEMIDTFFASKDAPLLGYGRKMAEEAMKNDLDWRLLAALSFIESTSGKNPCYNDPDNVFGWGSCKIQFNSIDEAIERVAINVGGNNPKTAHHYDNKTTIGKLKSYNSVIPTYAKKIFSTMDKIGPLEDVSLLAKDAKVGTNKEVAMAF